MIRVDKKAHVKYHFGMEVTIDKAGRVVVPKSLRDRYNLPAGTVLEVVPRKDGLLLRVPTGEVALVRKRGILVHTGNKPSSDIDIAAFIRCERERRSMSLPQDGKTE
jgi:AbrB family looped-hinge helix DNA binding protein